MNVWDGLEYPYGWGVCQDGSRYSGSCEPDMTEPKRLVLELVGMGVSLFGITLGIPKLDPGHNRPSAQYMGASISGEHPLVGVGRFIRMTTEIQKCIPGIPVVSAGLAWLGRHMSPVAAGMIKDGGCMLAGFGRGALASPGLPDDIANKSGPKNICTTCSKCSFLFCHDNPAGCVIWDKEMYLQRYQDLAGSYKEIMNK